MKNLLIKLFLFLIGSFLIYLGVYNCLIMAIIEVVRTPEVSVVVWSLVKIFGFSAISIGVGFALVLASLKKIK